METTRTSPGLAQPTALVIEPALPHLVAILTTLAALGFDTTVAETYHDARTALAAHPPMLLVTGLKLREYNGLHLVSRGVRQWPHLAAIVTSDAADPVLQAESERLGATFVVMPAPADELSAAICRTVLRPPEARREPVSPPFERRAGSRRACTSMGTHTVSRLDRRKDVREAIQAMARSSQA